MEDTDCLVDLLDYCHRKMTGLLGGEEEEREEREEEEEESSDEEKAADPKVDLLKVYIVISVVMSKKLEAQSFRNIF